MLDSLLMYVHAFQLFDILFLKTQRCINIVFHIDDVRLNVKQLRHSG